VDIDNRKRINLGDIEIKTLLFYPPPGSFLYPPLSIPQLKAYLDLKNYQHLKIIDLSLYPQSRFKIAALNYIFRKIANSSVLVNLIYRSRNRKFVKKFNHLSSSFVEFFRRRRAHQNLSLNWSRNSIANYVRDYPPEKFKYHRFIKSLIINEDISLVGFSVMYPGQLMYALMISKIIKTLNKDIFVVMGGAQVTKNIKHLIEQKEWSNLVDGYVVNDGEEPLAELVYRIGHSKNLDQVPNLYFKNGETYSRSSNSFSCGNECLLTPDFDGFFFFHLPLRLSMGCPWGKCTFCTYRLFHKRYSCGEIDEVIKIIKSLQERYSISNFSFIDDFLPPVFLKRLSESLIKEDIKILWSCSIGLVPGFNSEIVRSMVKSGCRSIRTGLESMAARVLRLMDKPHTPELAKTVLALFKDSGIQVNINIIFGFPTETEEEASITLDFLQANAGDLFDSVVIQQFSLEEDTIIFNEPRRFGITKIYGQEINLGMRMGYEYEVDAGMTREQGRIFTERARRLMGIKFR
jgi:anaerobic magnesium-protoporphyrin IX monomethyl ester cyclase